MGIADPIDQLLFHLISTLCEQTSIIVNNAAGLLGAVERSVKNIEVDGKIEGLLSFRLSPGVRIHGVDDQAALLFQEGQPGLFRSADHEVSGLRLVTDET